MRHARRILTWVGALVAVGYLTLLFLRPVYNIDIFWHIEAGQLIVDTGAIPSTDTFSAEDPTKPWTPFQWLYEVAVYALDEAGGLPLLRVVHAAIQLVAFVLLFLMARRKLGSTALAALFVLVTLVFWEDRIRVRPHVLNLLFLAVSLPYLLGGWRRMRVSHAVAIALVGGLWANLHAGGSLLLLVCLGSVAGGAVVTYLLGGAVTGRQTGFITGSFLMTLFVMLPMPGFVAGVTTAFTMYDASKILIPEWSGASHLLTLEGSPHFVIAGTAPYVVAGLLTLWLLFRLVAPPGRSDGPLGLRARLAAVPWGMVAMGGAALFLAIHSVRFVYLTAIPLLFLMTRWRAFEGRHTFRPAWVTGALVPWLLVAVAFGVTWQYNVQLQRRGLVAAVEGMAVDLETSRFPVHAADFLVEAGLEGKIYNWPSWGGYLLHRLWPSCSVFSDGRGNLDDAMVETILATGSKTSRYTTLDAAWEAYHFDIVVFPEPVFHLRLWDKTKWVRIYHDPQVEVFLRKSPSNEANLAKVEAFLDAKGYDVSFDTQLAQAKAEHAALMYGGAVWMGDPARKGLFEAAAETLAEGGPGKSRAAIMVGSTLFDLGKYDEAFGVFASVVQDNPCATRARFFMGLLYHLNGQHDMAAQVLAPIQACETFPLFHELMPPYWRLTKRMQTEMGWILDYDPAATTSEVVP